MMLIRFVPRMFTDMGAALFFSESRNPLVDGSSTAVTSVDQTIAITSQTIAFLSTNCILHSKADWCQRKPIHSRMQRSLVNTVNASWGVSVTKLVGAPLMLLSQMAWQA